MTHTRTAEDRLREFVLKSFPLARKRGFDPEEKWLETGLVDSLGILDIVQFLEREFSLQITDDELVPENFGTFASVVAFVHGKIASSLDQRASRATNS